MLASGRLSSEIVLKCARCGIPLLASRAAPTSLAVDIAESAALTLVGFTRGDKMNVYTGRQRIYV
jgi:FdhD protein